MNTNIKIYIKHQNLITGEFLIHSPNCLEIYLRSTPSDEYILEVAGQKYLMHHSSRCDHKSIPVLSPTLEDAAMELQYNHVAKGDLLLTENSDFEYFFNRHNQNPAYRERGIEYWLQVGIKVFVIHAYEPQA